MGDRISIQFKKENDLSGVFYAHWDGMELKERAKGYIRVLVKENILEFTKSGKRKREMPLDRLEPDVVMASFISEIIGQGKRLDSNYRVLEDTEYCDMNDNGHHLIDIDKIEKMLWDAYKIGIEKRGEQLLEEIEN